MSYKLQQGQHILAAAQECSPLSAPASIMRWVVPQRLPTDVLTPLLTIMSPKMRAAPMLTLSTLEQNVLLGKEPGGGE